MSDTNAAATLSLAITTDEAQKNLDSLLSKYNELKAGLSSGISAGSFGKEATAEINSLKAAISSYETKNRDLINQVQALTDRFKTFSAAAKESAASVGANISGVAVKARADLKDLGSTFDDVTRSIIEERKRLAEGGIDFGSSIKGLELVQKSTTENINALSRYIGTLEIAKKALTELNSPELLKQKYGSTILTEIGNLDAYKAKLASLRDMAKATSKETEVEDKSSSERKIATHLSEVNKRRALEKEYSTWWASELKQREAAYAASMLRTVQQRSSMMRVSEERLSRGMVAPSAGTSELAQYYAAMPGAVAGGGSGLAQAEMAAAASAAAAAQKSLGNSHKSTAVAVKEHTAAQQKWNATSNEAHALARGLSGSLGTLWMTYGQMVPLLAGAALGAGFKAAAQSGAELAYQLTFVKALSEETAGSVDVLSKNTLALAKNSLYGPTEIASGYRILAQAGLDVSSSMKAMPHVLHLATVGEMEMEQAAVTLVGVMNAFNLSIKDAEHVGDVFAKAAALSQTSVVGMTNAMKTASVVGEQYGASMEDTATAITLLAKVNITGTAAGTAFRNMLKELYAPSREAAGVMEKLQLKTKDAAGNLRPFADVIYDLKGKLGDFGKGDQVQILQKLFGERGAKEAVAMLALTKKEWLELRDSITNSDGFMGKVSKQLEDEVKGKWVQAMNTMKASLAEAYATMAPTFSRIADSLKTLFDSESFKSGISSLVTGMVSLADIAVRLAPALLTLAQGWVALKVGMISAAAITAGAAAWTGYANAAMVASGIMGPFASNTAAASGALRAMAASATIVSLPFSALVGTLAAAGTAMYLFRDRTAEAMEQSAQKVSEFSKEALKNLTDLLKKIDSTSAAISRVMLNSHEAVISNNIDTLESMRKTLGSKFGLGDAAEIEAYIAKIDRIAESGKRGAKKYDQSADPEMSSAAAKAQQGSDKYKAAKAYYDILQDTRRVQDLLSTATSRALNKEYQETRAKIELEESANQRNKRNASEVLGGDDRGSKARMQAESLRERAEKASIAKIEQQQKSEIDRLNSLNSNKLITEESYRMRLSAIYDKYDAELDGKYDAAIKRREDYAKTVTGVEKEQVEAGLHELKNVRAKHESDMQLRTQQSQDRQAGVIKSSWESTSKFIAEKTADIQKQIDDLGDAQRRLAMSPREEVMYDAGRKVDDSFRKQEADQLEKIRDLRNDLIAQNMAMGADFVDAYTSADMNSQLMAYREQLEKLIEARDKLRSDAVSTAGDRYDFTRQFSTGWAQAFKEYQENATNSATAAEIVFEASTSAMSDGLVQLFTTGKLGWRDLASTALKEVLRVMANKAVASFMGLVMEWGIGLMTPSLQPGNYTTASMGSIPASDYSALTRVPSANGNVFSDTSLSRYSNTVQTTPQYFSFNKMHKFANGGVFAEAGPEAVMPLARDSNGRLGVRAQGGSSTNVGITVIVNQADGSVNTKASGAPDQAWRQMANRVRTVVVEEIGNQKRPGGLLYGT